MKAQPYNNLNVCVLLLFVQLKHAIHLDFQKKRCINVMLFFENGGSCLMRQSVHKTSGYMDISSIFSLHVLNRRLTCAILNRKQAPWQWASALASADADVTMRRRRQW